MAVGRARDDSQALGGVVGGYAPLDSSLMIPTTYVPSPTASNTLLTGGTAGVDNTWTDITGGSVSLTAGTWLVWASCYILCADGSEVRAGIRVTDGTNHYAAAATSVIGSIQDEQIATPAVKITLGSTTTIKMQGIINRGGSNTVFRNAPTANSSGNIYSGISAIKVT